MPLTKEEKAVYNKAYNQSLAGKKMRRKARWKEQGIIIDDFDKFYQKFLSTTNCEMCKKELTIDRRNTHSTKCVDHDHSINDRPNVRMICCNTCNANDKSTNKTGEPNISFRKDNKCWTFSKLSKGKTIRKSGFKTFEEALEYKKDYLSTLA